VPVAFGVLIAGLVSVVMLGGLAINWWKIAGGGSFALARGFWAAAVEPGRIVDLDGDRVIDWRDLGTSLSNRGRR